MPGQASLKTPSLESRCAEYLKHEDNRQLAVVLQQAGLKEHVANLVEARGSR